jgi:adenylate cyclase
MALEIERKYLVCSDEWRAGVEQSIPIRQGYFCRTPLLRARIRVFGERGFITLKSEAGTLVRHEYEYEIPKADAIEIIERFSIEPLITKTRHHLTYDGVLWAVDVFEGENAGLVMAEVELTSQEQRVSVPKWAGQEVTADSRYGNSNLASAPFSTWQGQANTFG